jgi:nicotinate-nucleotide pyrophosphorylase (carboxylating)
MQNAPDIRHQIFREHMGRNIVAVLVAEAAGVVSGIDRAGHLIESLGLDLATDLADGAVIDSRQEIARVAGNPLQIAQVEERIIGAVSKSSGIATAARRARLLAGSRCKVVSGGWKKMPLEIKDLVRKAAQDGGIDIRICDEPFLYLDKNYVRILGGVGKAVRAVAHLGRSIVVQVRGETDAVENEALEAGRAGAAVVMVDTGLRQDLANVGQALRWNDFRSRVRIAFSGNVSHSDMESLVLMDVDVVDIGYAILDAPCLPMRFDVIEA